jgi:hypothetical protein
MRLPIAHSSAFRALSPSMSARSSASPESAPKIASPFQSLNRSPV